MTVSALLARQGRVDRLAEVDRAGVAGGWNSCPQEQRRADGPLAASFTWGSRNGSGFAQIGTARRDVSTGTPGTTFLDRRSSFVSKRVAPASAAQAS